MRRSAVCANRALWPLAERLDGRAVRAIRRVDLFALMEARHPSNRSSAIKLEGTSGSLFGKLSHSGDPSSIVWRRSGRIGKPTLVLAIHHFLLYIVHWSETDRPVHAPLRAFPAEDHGSSFSGEVSAPSRFSQSAGLAYRFVNAVSGGQTIRGFNIFQRRMAIWPAIEQKESSFKAYGSNLGESHGLAVVSSA